MDADEYVDMALLCFGNDFMPNFAMFSLREDGYGRALYFWTHGGLPAAAKEEHKVLCKRAKETDRHIVAPDGYALEARLALQKTLSSSIYRSDAGCHRQWWGWCFVPRGVWSRP
jgi:hypothetical protein